MSSDPGTERTIAAADTLFAEPLQVAGQLNLAGEAQIAPAELSAAGVAEAEGRDALPIGAAETVTIGPRSIRKGEPVEIGGQLNIAGQLEVAPNGAALDAAAEPSASGTADATGTAATTQTRPVAASGEAIALGTAAIAPERGVTAAGVALAEARAALPIGPTETVTIGGASARKGEPVEIGGQLNIAGQLEVTPGGAALDTERSVAAAGTADTVGAAALAAERLLAADGVAEAIGQARLSADEPVTRFSRESLGWQEDEEVTVGWQEDEEVTVGWQEDESITLDTEAGGSEN